MEIAYFGAMALLIVIEIINYKERKELYNRIMARDLADYQANSGKIAARPTTNMIRKSMEQHQNDV